MSEVEQEALSYAEVIYETGSKSVVSYVDLEEMKSGLKNHHLRAVNGVEGGPSGQPAERIKKIILYDKHPGDYNEESTLSKDVLQSELSSMLAAEGSVVNLNELAAKIRDLSSSLAPVGGSPHDSQFKMEGTELPLDFLEEGGN